MRDLYAQLKQTFPLGELAEQRPNLAFVSVPREHLRALLLELRDRQGFGHLVLLTAVPAILPFLLIDDRHLALRVSNLLLVGLLFLTGWHWARATHSNPWVFGTSFLVAGLGMVFVAMAFGG